MNLHLHGNHKPCPECKGSGDGPKIIWHRGEVQCGGASWPSKDVHELCPTCRGTGRTGETP